MCGLNGRADARPSYRWRIRLAVRRWTLAKRWRDWRGAPEDTLLLHGSAAIGRVFREGYPAETTEAFLDGHVSAFEFFGGVPLSILYDNLKIAVVKICGDGKRERTRAFTELVSHYLFKDRFGRCGKGNDKGKVEGLVKYARANFMTPIPISPNYEALNGMLSVRCLAGQSDRAGRRTETIGERLAADTAIIRTLPATPLEPCEKRAARVSSTALVRNRGNDYSTPTSNGFQDVLVKGFVEEVVILCRGEEIARHWRSYGHGVFVYRCTIWR
jgi:hypothetical protein